MKHPELLIQQAIVQYVRLKYPNIIIFHCANSGSYGAKYGGILKSIGVLSGVSDLILIWRGGIGFMEV